MIYITDRTIHKHVFLQFVFKIIDAIHKTKRLSVCNIGLFLLKEYKMNDMDPEQYVFETSLWMGFWSITTTPDCKTTRFVLLLYAQYELYSGFHKSFQNRKLKMTRGIGQLKIIKRSLRIVLCCGWKTIQIYF